MLNRRLLLCAASTMAIQVLVGCKEERPGADELVRYRGTSLFVMDVEYKRERLDFTPAKGLIQVTAREGMEPQLEDLLRRFSLDVTRTVEGTRFVRGKTFIVAVPANFELQWAMALSSQPSVLHSGLE